MIFFPFSQQASGGKRNNIQVQGADAGDNGHLSKANRASDEAALPKLEARHAADEAAVVVASADVGGVLEGGPHVGGGAHGGEPHDSKEEVHGKDGIDDVGGSQTRDLFSQENVGETDPAEHNLKDKLDICVRFLVPFFSVCSLSTSGFHV